MRRERREAIARSMYSLGVGLARVVHQLAAVVGQTSGWIEPYVAQGFTVVYRPWGAEIWAPGTGAK